MVTRLRLRLIQDALEMEGRNVQAMVEIETMGSMALCTGIEMELLTPQAACFGQ